MRRKSTIKYLLALLTAITMVSLCGCVWLGEALGALTPAETDEGLGTEAASAAPTEAAANASEGDNPVLVFVTDFMRAFSAASNGLADYAYEQGGEKAELAMLLMRDESKAALVASTVGMLGDRSALGAFSGTVTGAYSGNGNLSKEGEFTFTLDSGGTVKGSFAKNALTAAVPGGKLSLYKVNGEYLLWFTDGEGTGIISMLGRKLRYARYDEKLEPKPELPVKSPAAELAYSHS